MHAVSPQERFIVQIFPDRGSFDAVKRERVLKEKNFSFPDDPEPYLEREIFKDADIDCFRAVTEKFHPHSIRNIFFCYNADIHIGEWPCTAPGNRAEQDKSENGIMSPQLFHDGNNCGGKTTRAVLFLHNKPLLYYPGGGFLICFYWDFDIHYT